MGWPQSKGIIEKHNGSIQIASPLAPARSGATVTVTVTVSLPRIQ